MENLNCSKDINRARENIKENSKISAKGSLGLYELKQHIPWFNEECSQFLDKRKWAKMQWLLDPNQGNVDNLNNVRCAATRISGITRRNIFKLKLMNLKLTVRQKISDLFRGISDLKKVYWPSINIVCDEKVDLVTDSHSILVMWRNHFCQLFKVHGFSDVKQTEIHTAEPFMSELSAFEVEMTIEKLKRSPGTDKIPAKLIKAWGMTIHSEIHKLINSIWNKEELPEVWSHSLHLSIRRATIQITIIIGT